jgi:rRNA processing protein Gar1
MEILGKVKEITPDGRLIVQCPDTPEIGEPVFDADQNRIGVVKRVFGPVSGPYASVETKAVATDRMKGTDLYTRGGNKRGKDKGRSRRNRGLPGVRQSPPGS